MYICIVIFQKKICISQDSKHDVSMWCDHIYVDGVKKIMIMEQSKIEYYAKTQNNCLFDSNERLYVLVNYCLIQTIYVFLPKFLI